MSKETELEALGQARLLLDAFIAHHRAAAIPAMVAACVGWSIENGAGDLIRKTLSNASEMSVAAEKAWNKGRN